VFSLQQRGMWKAFGFYHRDRTREQGEQMKVFKSNQMQLFRQIYCKTCYAKNFGPGVLMFLCEVCLTDNYFIISGGFGYGGGAGDAFDQRKKQTH
jgi:hypothetical protein